MEPTEEEAEWHLVAALRQPRVWAMAQGDFYSWLPKEGRTSTDGQTFPGKGFSSAMPGNAVLETSRR